MFLNTYVDVKHSILTWRPEWWHIASCGYCCASVSSTDQTQHGSIDTGPGCVCERSSGSWQRGRRAIRTVCVWPQSDLSGCIWKDPSAGGPSLPCPTPIRPPPRRYRLCRPGLHIHSGADSVNCFPVLFYHSSSSDLAKASIALWFPLVVRMRVRACWVQGPPTGQRKWPLCNNSCTVIYHFIVYLHTLMVLSSQDWDMDMTSFCVGYMHDWLLSRMLLWLIEHWCRWLPADECSR